MISSATSHYHEFNNSTDFRQHFKKRPFDQNVLENENVERIHKAYKKIKTTTLPVNSQQTTKSTKTTFAAPLHSLRMGTNYSPPFGLYEYIDLRRDYENETNSLSDIPRIIDLSTGESLESIPSVEQLKKSRNPKRPIELVENKDNLIEGSFHSHKRIRTSIEHMRNFIEEEETDINEPKELRIEPIEPSTFIYNKANSVNYTEKPQSTQPLSLYVHGKSIKFTVPYQDAMTRYMRSQFQHLNTKEYKEYEDEGKKVILYRSRNDHFKDSFIGSHGIKIFETMDLDVEASQIGAVSCYEDQMDID